VRSNLFAYGCSMPSFISLSSGSKERFSKVGSSRIHYYLLAIGWLRAVSFNARDLGTYGGEHVIYVDNPTMHSYSIVKPDRINQVVVSQDR